MRLSVLALCLLAGSFSLVSQIPSPTEFFGFERGDRFTAHHDLVEYFETVAEASPQVVLEQYGETYEHRPLVAAFISTAANIENLERLRQNHLRRIGMAEGAVPDNSDVSIVWLSYSVHGNEAGGSEAAPKVLYDLLTRPDAQEWLRNTIVVIDPSLNPDGYNRYTNWYRQRSNRLNNPDPASESHHEPWPGGRVNHYLFDLNRDWAWASQKETRHRLKLYRQWMPHIHADVHEQYPNNPYYFAPAAQPYHSAITKFQSEFQTDIGKNHARYFDQNGWLYFTREVFDLLYPSYGDTYPTFSGAIGMTYEQAGHGVSGRGIQMENGDTLTLKDRIDHHYTTSMSTIEIGSKRAADLGQQFRQYFKSVAENPSTTYRSYIVSSTNAPEKIQRLRELLDLHGIRYYRVGKGAGASTSLYDYSTNGSRQTTLSADDLLIPVNQPMGTLANVLFEPQTAVVDSLTYDITAWSLPMAHGLRAYASTKTFSTSEPYSSVTPRAAALPETPYAYLVRWTTLQDASFLGKLLQEGVRVRYASSPASFGGTRYDRGTLLITRADNRKNADYHEIVRRVARETGQELETVSTGFSDRGGDLGSASWQFLSVPKVVLLGGKRTNPNDFGHTWYFFEQELEYPLTVVDAERFGSLDLHDFDVVVMPNGSYRMDQDQQEKLSSWIQGGGKLIALGGAVGSLSGQPGFALERGENTAGSDTPTPEELTQPYAGGDRRSISDYNPGSVVRIKLDTTHPLAYGMDEDYFTLTTSSRTYPLQEKAHNVGYSEAEPTIYGFMGNNLRKRAGHKAHFAVEQKGRGRVVYMIDNPLFRSFWQNGKLMVANAIFFE